MVTLTTNQITSGKLFMVVCQSCFSLFVPIGIVSAIMVLIGITPVTFNEQATYGVTGFFVALLLYAILLPVGTTILISMVLLPGMWLYRLFTNVARKFFSKNEQPA